MKLKFFTKKENYINKLNQLLTNYKSLIKF